jgi:hypothetical protein
VKVLGHDTLRGIARELVATVRNNVTIDWTLRENVRAQLRVLVKRIFAQARVSAGQARKSNPDGARAGSVVVNGVGDRVGGVHEKKGRLSTQIHVYRFST